MEGNVGTGYIRAASFNRRVDWCCSFGTTRECASEIDPGWRISFLRGQSVASFHMARYGAGVREITEASRMATFDPLLQTAEKKISVCHQDTKPKHALHTRVMASQAVPLVRSKVATVALERPVARVRSRLWHNKVLSRD
jgi:hypothetical protein